MPYISQKERARFDGAIDELLNELNNASEEELPGEFNYIVSQIIWQLCGHRGYGRRRYNRMNAILGVIEAAKLEFYRRIVEPYEDEKIEQKGDL